MESKLEWNTSKKIIFKDRWKVPLGEEVPSNPIWQHPSFIRKLLPVLKPLDHYRNYVFVDGFVYKIIGNWIRDNISEDTTFLDIGCGDLILKRQLPKHVIYNAFDIRFSEYVLDLAVRLDSVNIAIASATKIPLKSNQVSMITSTNVLEHIPEIDRALEEINRIAKPDSLFLVCIPNNYCYKYFVKGQHEDHCNSWTYDGFINYVESFGFQIVEGLKKGWWIPFSKNIGNTSYHIPITSSHEYYNTCFFYVFKTQK